MSERLAGKFRDLCFKIVEMSEIGTPEARDWQDLVQRIRAEDACSVLDLYAVIAGAVPTSLARLGKKDSIEDDLHDILLVVLETIRRGALRQPDRLLGFVRTVARRRAVACIRGNVFERRHFGPDASVARSSEPTPEERLAARERVERVRRVLKGLRRRDREIMIRFYYREQRPEQICREMRLTPTQFRLFKSRALARCVELGRR
jgi:RNA polymerase sigma-70 factor, ECF subfamily